MLYSLMAFAVRTIPGVQRRAPGGKGTENAARAPALPNADGGLSYTKISDTILLGKPQDSPMPKVSASVRILHERNSLTAIDRIISPVSLREWNHG